MRAILSFKEKTVILLLIDLSGNLKYHYKEFIYIIYGKWMRIKTYIPFLENSGVASLSDNLHKKNKIISFGSDFSNTGKCFFI